jgi:hypothetical protein
MSKSRDLAALLDSSGDVVAGALDNAGGGGGGAWEVISSSTISSSVSSVEITIPTTHERYRLMVSNASNSGNAWLYVSLSTDGSTYLSSGYRYMSRSWQTDSTGNFNTNGYNTSPISLGLILSSFDGQFDLLNFNNTRHKKIMGMYSLTNDNVDGDSTSVLTAANDATSSVSKIKFHTNSGTFDSGTFTLYGIKTS